VVRIPATAKDFSPVRNVHTVSYSTEVNRPRRETGNSSQPAAKVKNVPSIAHMLSWREGRNLFTQKTTEMKKTEVSGVLKIY
jgi:hypothetical protein